MKNVLMYLILMVCISCKNENTVPKYFIDKEGRIIKIYDNSKVTLYDMHDSTKLEFIIKKNEIINKDFSFEFELSDNNFFIIDNKKLLSKKRNLKFNKFIKFNLDKESIINMYWEIDDFSTTIFLNDEECFIYDKNETLFEVFNYDIKTCFNEYTFFVPSNSFFFQNKSYLLTDKSSDSIVLLDYNNSNNFTLKKRVSKIDSLIFGNWTRIHFKINDSLVNISKNGSYSRFINDLIIKEDVLISNSNSKDSIIKYYYTFGLDSKTILLDDYSFLKVKKATKDSLILFNENIAIQDYRTLKYVRKPPATASL